MKNSNLLLLLLLAVIIGLTIYGLSPILMPFITSFILAYLFVPVVNKLETNFNIPRIFGSLIVILVIIFAFIALWLLLIPLIFEQIQLFIQQIPKYKEYAQLQVIPKISYYAGKLDASYVEKMQDNLNDTFTTIFQYTVSSFNNLWRSGMAFFNILSMLVLVPFITFYLIRDWRKVKSSSKHLLPISSQHKFQILISRINRALSGFIRGQINVCFVLALYYTIALSALGINFSIFLGITTGVLSFIPFIGLLTGLLISLLVTYFQFFAIKNLFFVAIVFGVGSLIENVVSPKLIGNKIGLHPVWLIFALLLGASCFGFLGMLFAIPCAAILNVIIKFLLELYYNSAMYLNKSSENTDE